MPPIFVSNPHGHYFTVNCALSVPDLLNLKCRVHDNEESMIRELTGQHDCSPDELEGMPICIRMVEDQYEVTDMVCMWSRIDDLNGQSIEQWIANYML